MLYIFENYLDYFLFTSSGQVREESSSHCLLPDSPLNFNSQYYFVGLESFVSSTLNYTVSGSVLEYNITNLSPTTCTFPSSECSIPLSDLPGGEDVCILATLQDQEGFPLNYTSTSTRAHRQRVAGWILLGIVAVLSLLVGWNLQLYT